MLFFQKKDCFKHLAVGISLITLGLMIKWIDPLSKVIDDQFVIKPGKFLFNLWREPPIGVYLKVFLFNVTNAEDFLSGKAKKLKVEEIGPYMYKEWLKHENVTFNANGTISYLVKRRCVPITDPVDPSAKNPFTDIVVTPNMILLGASSVVSKHSTVASYAFKMLAESFKAKPFLNLTVQEFLWGYEDPLLSLASNILPAFIHFKKFGIIDRLFDEGRNHITMHLPESIEQIEQRKQDLNRQVAINKIMSTSTTASSVLDVEYDDNDAVGNDASDQTTTEAAVKVAKAVNQGNEARRFSVDLWNGVTLLPGFENFKVDNTSRNCNRVQGVFDGTLFPRNVTKNEKFKVYRRAFCRILPIYYSHTGEKFNGLDAYFYELSENAFYDRPDDPDTMCFCETQSTCLRKGLGNISPCYYNIPAAVSQPHFYNADPSLLKEVDGMKPDKEKHRTILAMNPQMGIALNAFLRIQLNLVNGNLKFYDKIQMFSNSTLPIFWVELSLEKFTTYINLILQSAFVILPVVQMATIVILVFVGFVLAVIAIIPPIRKRDTKPLYKESKQCHQVELPLLISRMPERDVQER